MTFIMAAKCLYECCVGLVGSMIILCTGWHKINTLKKNLPRNHCPIYDIVYTKNWQKINAFVLIQLTPCKVHIVQNLSTQVSRHSDVPKQVRSLNVVQLTVLKILTKIDKGCFKVILAEGF